MALEGKTEQEADGSFEAEVSTSLRLPAQIGNIYTGSLYLALASLLDAEAQALEGKRVALFSYGSGCAAEFFAGRVAAGAGAFAAQLRLAEVLEGRRRYTIAEYETIRGADADGDKRPVQTGAEQRLFAPGGGVAFLGVQEEKRIYYLDS